MKKTYAFIALIGILVSANFTRITVDNDPGKTDEMNEVAITTGESDNGTAFNEIKANLLANRE
ncbi:hypothetical protein [Arenibacter certesii]|uniref:Uncharacterized protein n=1 Tax=Arenibacter certesii TaxID=228955 RepID=A0A918IRS3_9FLAO|nr:hypothetical protein [Arenibacter certesii]GGW27772.1 hypothetical protein GCM10007383_11550 [Arenibacter certesii]